MCQYGIDKNRARVDPRWPGKWHYRVSTVKLGRRKWNPEKVQKRGSTYILVKSQSRPEGKGQSIGESGVSLGIRAACTSDLKLLQFRNRWDLCPSKPEDLPSSLSSWPDKEEPVRQKCSQKHCQCSLERGVGGGFGLALSIPTKD